MWQIPCNTFKSNQRCGKGQSSAFILCILTLDSHSSDLAPRQTARQQPPDADGWISHWEELLISSFFPDASLHLRVPQRERPPRAGQAARCPTSGASRWVISDGAGPAWSGSAGNNPWEALRGRRACHRSCVRKMKRDWIQLLEVAQHRWRWGVIREGPGVVVQAEAWELLLLSVSDTFKLPRPD